MTNRGVVESAGPGTPVSFARRRRRWLFEIALPLFVYVLVAAPATYRRAQAINPDAVCYIRRAVYLVGSQYHWSDVPSGYWSPLFSWCIAPLIKLGVDGLIAAKLVLLFWGGVWVLTSGAFLRRICPTTPRIRAGAGVVLAIVGAVEAVSYVTPDIILAALLFAYLTLAARPRLLTGRRSAFGAGLVGGLAYLAKSYALPFFFAHAAFAVLYRLAHQRSPWRRALVTGGAMFAGFFLLAAPWIAVLSAKYHKPTFSTVGPAAHAAIAPPWIPRGARGGEVPPDPYLTMNEVPELGSYAFWSPFSSHENFDYQKKIFWRHLLGSTELPKSVGMLGVLARLDMLRLSLVAVAIAGALAVLRVFGRRFRDKRHVFWVLVTAAIYASGFLFVYFEPRYVNSVFPPLALALCLQLYSRFRSNALSSSPGTPGKNQGGNPRSEISDLRSQKSPHPESSAEHRKRGQDAIARRLLRNPMILPTIIAVSFGLTGVRQAWSTMHDQPLPIRKLARAVRAPRIHGPITTTPANRTQGIYVAYMADVKVIAFPSVGRHAAPGIPPALTAAHVDGIVCFVPAKKGATVNGDAAHDAAVAGGWTLASRVTLDRKHTAEIWVPPALATTTSAPTTRRLRTK